MNTDWLILAATQPTHPSGLRVRVWRGLKATGAGTLRDGVHLLPAQAPSAPALRALAQAITEAGAEAHLLALRASDNTQEQAFRRLFDRSEQHAEFLLSIKETNAGLPQASETTLRRQLRELDSRWQAIRAVDFFPDATAGRSAEALAALRQAVERRCSPGEPVARAQAIPTLSIDDHQGRTWATRKRPWVDRLASAWLIQRFIDRQPRFIWLSEPSACPPSALGYDFDGAAFTHVGEQVTFEVLAQSFTLLADPALRRLAAVVHHIDVGGLPVDEAPGLQALVRGLQALHPEDDNALLAAALPLFDALHAALQPDHDT
jgi:hypothetical protein